jgi:hypothetical protein
MNEWMNEYKAYVEEFINILWNGGKKKRERERSQILPHIQCILIAIKMFKVLQENKISSFFFFVVVVSCYDPTYFASHMIY